MNKHLTLIILVVVCCYVFIGVTIFNKGKQALIKFEQKQESLFDVK